MAKKTLEEIYKVKKAAADKIHAKILAQKKQQKNDRLIAIGTLFDKQLSSMLNKEHEMMEKFANEIENEKIKKAIFEIFAEYDNFKVEKPL